ncbi:hypothetical protein JQ557_02635 [Bradyrhizobium sp. U87765 SZCCT0131]|uniref:hypothetical protein n=1 Tax=unclassified Bradyrhizobium TaxID=2631580 RepID=UPI001BAB1990|nr:MULTISPECIES: hypothetical protein [unclassified Bradyrhizobium]MBR1216872.1 hypothetical protein [Bradyrhizobium sp. U87765 SZCCT0131]MBR1259372.1 hypothetical protein [Bradyrhizobium sp. U87765 SZCCT0134]MBR1305513.1 hypothetical protein [Bradyrhizobium sp. U87765 SZCCT0110]MBR1321880.1 hypothetical protein [Bradyrhizobium sp. U87765 SZCCT0109]MBR1350842.1 hypothetical protein [Bradyrhizobium sp. U87765 SZCCT0048]
MNKPDYAKNYETLVAVITHLAVNKWALRQPKGIAKDLSIDVDAVRPVLRAFKGLFRESKGVSKDHGDHYYSLHLRHSRQIVDDNVDQERPPLEPEYLFNLLRVISEKSAQQSQQLSALRIAALTSIVSLVVAMMSIAMALHKA